MAVMGDNPSSYGGPKRPVEGVSWNEIQEFIRRLSMKTGKPYRLPSEWEYAARAGGTTNYLLSDDARELEQYAWTAQNSGRMTHPVGEKPANKFGLHDMIGNVYEWTQDCYHDNYVDAPTDGGFRSRVSARSQGRIALQQCAKSSPSRPRQARA
jgi:formylglycine-generating enzyme required for sulfatase activity